MRAEYWVLTMDLSQLTRWKLWFYTYFTFSTTPLLDHLRWLWLSWCIILALLFVDPSEWFSLLVQVLYRFLEFFSKFDWDNFCVSLWGPVPISALPDVTGID